MVKKWIFTYLVAQNDPSLWVNEFMKLSVIQLETFKNK